VCLLSEVNHLQKAHFLGSECGRTGRSLRAPL